MTDKDEVVEHDSSFSYKIDGEEVEGRWKRLGGMVAGIVGGYMFLLIALIYIITILSIPFIVLLLLLWLLLLIGVIPADLLGVLLL